MLLVLLVTVAYLVLLEMLVHQASKDHPEILGQLDPLA